MEIKEKGKQRGRKGGKTKERNWKEEWKGAERGHLEEGGKQRRDKSGEGRGKESQRR